MKSIQKIFIGLNLFLFIGFVAASGLQGLLNAGKSIPQDHRHATVQHTQVLSGNDLLCERDVENEKESLGFFKHLFCQCRLPDLDPSLSHLHPAIQSHSVSGNSSSLQIFLEIRNLRI